MSQELSEEKEEKLEEEEEKILRNLISMTGLDQDEILTRLKKERDKIKPLKDALSELKKHFIFAWAPTYLQTIFQQSL
jgi:hypothetical protein